MFLEWSPTSLAGYLDGHEWFRDTHPHAQPPGPMHQTIQLDNFHRSGGMETAHMDVRWYREYRYQPIWK